MEDDDDKDREDLWTEKVSLDPEAVSKVSHEVTRPFAPETSSFESLRKKGCESISNFIKGFFHNKEGNSVTNKEQTCADEEQSDVIEIDIKDSAKEQVEAVKIKGSRSEDTKV